jgi:hypothetical protein
MTTIIVNLAVTNSLEVAFMAQAETSQFTSAAPQSIPGAIIDIVVTIVRAFMGSLLGISTAAFFGVFGLVAFADVPLDVAITSVALAMNAMLLSLVVLGNLGRQEDD